MVEDDTKSASYLGNGIDNDPLGFHLNTFLTDRKKCNSDVLKKQTHKKQKKQNMNIIWL